jgi:hypothetical protein
MKKPNNHISVAVTRLFFYAIIFFAVELHAQDTSRVNNQSAPSTASVRPVNHEIGFNMVSLLAQVAMFTPQNVPQMPFDVFYNLYIKDIVGFRIGAGFNNRSFSEEPHDAIEKNDSSIINSSYRYGISVNFVHHKRFTFNAFFDFVTSNGSSESMRTTTTNVFPDPFIRERTENKFTITGRGIHFGVGLKLNVHKHISFYTEIPFMFMWQNVGFDQTIKETGLDDSIRHSSSSVFTRQNILPATVYIVMRF